MKRRSTAALALLVALVTLGFAAAGCGEEHELEVVEGEPLELGDLSYNVQITRFLNPRDPEDEGYLEGVQVPAPSGEMYLGVFLTIENESDSAVRIPQGFQVVDTQGNAFRPVQSESVFALELGGTIPPGGEIPEPDTPAASGPISGSMIVFLVGEESTENRPLVLEVPAPGGEDGVIELDI